LRRAVRTIRRLLDLALILLVITILAIALAANLGPGLGHDLFVIRGGSMSPTIPIGGLVAVRHVAPGDLRVGDIVTIKATDGVLDTHRITRIVQLPAGIYIETKGDANQDPDPVLSPASAIVGRVDFSLPIAGYLLYVLTLPIGVLSIFSLAITMLLAIWLLQEFEEDGEDECVEPVPYEMPGLMALLARNNDFPSRPSEWTG
jgi:signal peptidase